MGCRLFLLPLGLSAAGLYVACSSATSPPTAGDARTSEGDGSVAADSSLMTPEGGILPVATPDAAGGEPCEASTDCPSGLSCMYPLSEGCSATGVCTVLAASKCGGPYCACRGDTTAACGDYGTLPMTTPLHGPPCGAINGDGGQTDGGRDGG